MSAHEDAKARYLETRGPAARRRRAAERARLLAAVDAMTPEERLLLAIFGGPIEPGEAPCSP